MQDADHWLQERIVLLEQHKLAEDDYNQKYAGWQDLCEALQLAEDSYEQLELLQQRYQDIAALLDDIHTRALAISNQCSREREGPYGRWYKWEERSEYFRQLQQRLVEERAQLASGIEVWTIFDRSRALLEEVEQRLESNWSEIPAFFEGRLHLADDAEVLEQFRIQFMMDQEEDWDESNPSSNLALAQSIRYRAKQRYLQIDFPAPKEWNIESAYQAMETLDFQVQWSAQLPNILQGLSLAEVEQLSIPAVPYTAKSIGDFLKSVQDLKAERSFTARFQNRYRCTEKMLQIQNIAARIQRGQPFVEMALISSGRYSIGERDHPLGRRPVTLSRSFFMGMQPVTQQLFHFVYPKHRFAFEADDAPVECVTWFQALAFCNALSKLDGLEPCYQLASSVASIRWNIEANGYRLPTEMEWEAAAQTGLLHLSTYTLLEHAWCMDNSHGQTHAVAQKKPNQRCIYDMLGNVWEWCWDGYGEYSPQATFDPKGVQNASRRIIRGGSWRNSTAAIGVSKRDKEIAAEARDDLGFRLARNAWTTRR